MPDDPTPQPPEAEVAERFEAMTRYAMTEAQSINVSGRRSHVVRVLTAAGIPDLLRYLLKLESTAAGVPDLLAENARLTAELNEESMERADAFRELDELRAEIARIAGGAAHRALTPSDDRPIRSKDGFIWSFAQQRWVAPSFNSEEG